jgi:D-sedoheptulose 7-phosphate isomerase
VNTSSLTAIANDYEFDEVFARQILALGSPGDVAVALSTSGRSPNVIRGVQAAGKKGLVTVALTGQDGGMLKDHVDFCVCVPSTEASRIQECHIVVGHILCEILEAELSGQTPGPA